MTKEDAIEMSGVVTETLPITLRGTTPCGGQMNRDPAGRPSDRAPRYG